MRSLDYDSVSSFIAGLSASGTFFFKPDATLWETSSVLIPLITAAALTNSAEITTSITGATSSIKEAITSSYLSTTAFMQVLKIIQE